MQSVLGVPDSNAVAMEILLPWPVNFELNVHLPVLQVAWLHRKRVKEQQEISQSGGTMAKTRLKPRLRPHHSVPDGSLFAPLIRSEADVGAGHQRASWEVPLTGRAAANPCSTNTPAAVSRLRSRLRRADVTMLSHLCKHLHTFTGGLHYRANIYTVETRTDNVYRAHSIRMWNEACWERNDRTFVCESLQTSFLFFFFFFNSKKTHQWLP